MDFLDFLNVGPMCIFDGIVFLDVLYVSCTRLRNYLSCRFTKTGVFQWFGRVVLVYFGGYITVTG